jgi:pyridoxal phosphate enzyme (YggS family)
MTIKDNLTSIQQRIAEAASRRERSAEIMLVAVTKTVPAEKVREALALGIRDIGESRIQEAQVKFPELGDTLINVRRHLIGHLQTNKVKKAVELFDIIQSLDSMRLAVEIDQQAAKQGKVQHCLLEVKVSEEETKFGLKPVEALAFASQVATLKNIKVTGLMAMAPYFPEPEQVRSYFRKARELFDQIKDARLFNDFTVLSMGMSGDFDVAIEEGATMVRIGSALFE